MKNKVAIAVAMLVAFASWVSLETLLSAPTYPAPQTGELVVSWSNHTVLWPTGFWPSNAQSIASALNLGGTNATITNITPNASGFTNAWVWTEVPSASTNALPGSGQHFLAIDETSVYFGQANIGGNGTNWTKVNWTGF